MIAKVQNLILSNLIMNLALKTVDNAPPIDMKDSTIPTFNLDIFLVIATRVKV